MIYCIKFEETPCSTRRFNARIAPFIHRSFIAFACIRVHCITSQVDPELDARIAQAGDKQGAVIATNANKGVQNKLCKVTASCLDVTSISR